MTYCVGILVREGLVMIADTRSNAGLDNIATFRKLHLFQNPGDRMIALATAGNLAVRFPDSRVLHTEYVDFRPPGRGNDQCLLVWDRERGEVGDRDTPEMPEDLRAFAAGLRIRLNGTEPVGVIEAPFRFDPRHVRRVHYVLLPRGQGWCR
jgi:hypothetical protein